MHLTSIISIALTSLALANGQHSAQPGNTHAPAHPEPSSFTTSIKKTPTDDNMRTFTGIPKTTALAKREPKNNAYTVTEYHCGSPAVIIGDAGLAQYHKAIDVSYDSKAHAYVAPPCADGSS